MTRRTIETPFTYMITPGRLTAATYGMGRDALADLIGDLARQGLGAVQIREKALPASLQYDLAVRVRRAISGSRALCFVNERFDIAAAAGVDGVFMEVHEDPDHAPSDGPNMVRLKDLKPLLEKILRIRQALHV